MRHRETFSSSEIFDHLERPPKVVRAPHRDGERRSRESTVIGPGDRPESSESSSGRNGGGFGRSDRTGEPFELRPVGSPMIPEDHSRRRVPPRTRTVEILA